MNRIPIKILYGINQLGIGGAELQLFELAAGIRNFGYYPYVFSLSEGGEYVDLLRQEEIPVFIAQRRKNIDLRPIWQLSDFLRGHRIDLIHLFGFYAGFYGRIATIFSRSSKTVYSIRSTKLKSIRSLSSPTYFFIDRILSRRTDAITANAKAVREFAINDIKLSGENIHVIYNGISNKWFQSPNIAPSAKEEVINKYNLPSNCSLVGTVARLDPEKDHFTYISAAEIVIEKLPYVYFLIVGDGPLRQELENYVQMRDLSDRVIFAGKLIGDALMRHYDALDIYVSSSKAEGLSNSIIEAMAREKPIIATNTSGTPELIVNEKNGLLVDIFDSKTMAEKIINLLEDKNYANELGKEARKTAISCFSIEKMVEQYHLLYENLLEKRR